jgi:Fe(3+) dicitrate transport protein
MAKITFTKLFIFILICFFTQTLSAQVKGKLYDSNKKILAATPVYLNNGKSVITNQNGEFEFKNILDGSYTISVQIQEQLIQVQSFHKNSEFLNLGEIAIPKNQELGEIIIAKPLLNNGIERMPEIRDNVIYATKKNEVVKLNNATANLAQNNSRQIFAKVPGIHVWESDGSGVQMGIAARGLSPNRMWEFNTRQNGYDISSDPFGYPEAYYTPSVESLDRIEIIRGAASIQFGPQFGGMVNYIKKKSIAGKKIGVESTQTFGTYGLFSSFNAVGGSIGKWNYYANINYRRSDGWRQNNAYNTWNGFVNLGYKINHRMNIALELTRMDQLVQQPGGLNDSMFAIDPKSSSRSRNWFDLKWTIPALNFDYRINADNSLNVKIFGLIGERNSIGFLNAINLPDTINKTTGQYQSRRIDIDNYKNWGSEIRYLKHFQLFNQKQSLSLGMRYFEGETKRWRNTNGNTGSNYDLSVTNVNRSLDLIFKTKNTALFAEQLLNFNQRLSATIGFRYEMLNNTAEGLIAPNQRIDEKSSTRNFLLGGLGIQYKTTANTQVYFNATQAYRPVLFSDITPASTTDSIDVNLVDAQGYNIDLGYRGNVSKWLSYDVSVFYLFYGNRIGTYTINGKNFRTNIGNSISKGIESYAEVSLSNLLNFYTIGNVNIYASISLLDARYSEWNIPDMSKTIKDKKVENAPSEIYRTGINYRYRYFSAGFQFSMVGSTYSDANNTEKANATATSGIIPSYNVIDWTFQYSYRWKYNINGGINNLMDKAYFTRRAGGYPGPGLLPAEGRTAYLGIGIKF